MSKSINKVILIGNLGADPEIRYTPSGQAVTKVHIATNESESDCSGTLKKRTQWHQVVLFKCLAEISARYMHKGSKVYIEGSLFTYKWHDKKGHDRYSTEIHAISMQMLDCISTECSKTGKISNTNESNDPIFQVEDDFPF